MSGRTFTRRLLVPIAGAVVLAGVITVPNAFSDDGAAGPPQVVCEVAASAADNTGTTRSLPPDEAAALVENTRSYRGACVEYGPPVALGDGELRVLGGVTRGRPTVIGLSLTSATLRNLPGTMSDGQRCFDVNGDGTIGDMECAGGHQRDLQLPRNLTGLSTSAFRYVMVNWNVMGHGPPAVYTEPHFDIHFYLRSPAEVDAIRLGPCGNVVHCDDFATGRVPVPAEYNPADYGDYGFVQGKMGNHLVDKTSDEWNGGVFDRTFVYGSYNGEITYMEPMVSKAWIEGLATGATEPGCHPIKQPQQWQVAGWYPTEYCGFYRPNRDEYVISLAEFREATA
ncbi:hypothetical protein [Actinophytocola sp. NPDC049390]|uniref:hypothetical protein n=1 Tax=Actinophytocola sp. NPDC049390 TaxID=3363894 RepID=UPI00379BF378